MDAGVDNTGLRRRGPWRQAGSRFRRRPLGVAALVVLAAIFVVGALAATLAPYPAGREFLEFIDKPQPPFTAHHLLGTDVIGHDFLTQLLFAIHESVVSSLVCAGGATLIGTIVGALAGYFGGAIDAVVTWVTSVVVSVPALAVLLIVLVWSRFPPTPLDLGLWLMAVLWTGVARVVRGAIVSLRTREYVEAAHAAGASTLRVVVRHLLPNASGPVIVAGTALFAQSIVIVATVDYLGYGVEQVERPTLGSLVADAARGSAGIAAPWWAWVFPSVVLVLVLVCFNFLGDSLDDALNPAES